MQNFLKNIKPGHYFLALLFCLAFLLPVKTEADVICDCILKLKTSEPDGVYDSCTLDPTLINREFTLKPTAASADGKWRLGWYSKSNVELISSIVVATAGKGRTSEACNNWPAYIRGALFSYNITEIGDVVDATKSKRAYNLIYDPDAQTCVVDPPVYAFHIVTPEDCSVVNTNNTGCIANRTPYEAWGPSNDVDGSWSCTLRKEAIEEEDISECSEKTITDACIERGYQGEDLTSCVTRLLYQCEGLCEDGTPAGKLGCDISKSFKELNQLGITPNSNSVQVFIGRIIKYVLGFTGSLALAMFVLAGLIWMTARGNSERTSKALKIMTWAALGTVVILSSYVILDFIFKIFT